MGLLSQIPSLSPNPQAMGGGGGSLSDKIFKLNLNKTHFFFLPINSIYKAVFLKWVCLGSAYRPSSPRQTFYIYEPHFADEKTETQRVK